MADNKPALFPITAFIVSYHYARSDGSCVSRGGYGLRSIYCRATPDTRTSAAYTPVLSPPRFPLLPHLNPPTPVESPASQKTWAEPRTSAQNSAIG